MSLTSSVPNEEGVVFSAVGLPCFYCERVLTDAALHWFGATGHIYLHPACFLPLFVRLARDLHELEHPDVYRRRPDRA